MFILEYLQLSLPVRGNYYAEFYDNYFHALLYNFSTNICIPWHCCLVLFCETNINKQCVILYNMYILLCCFFLLIMWFIHFDSHCFSLIIFISVFYKYYILCCWNNFPLDFGYKIYAAINVIVQVSDAYISVFSMVCLPRSEITES